MDKTSAKKLIVFGLVLATALGLLAWGFAALKSETETSRVFVTTTGENEQAFGGIGIEITVKDGFVTVVQALEGQPAGRIGVQEGDRIVKINDEPVGEDPDIADIASKLRGEPGTEVTITVKRGDETKTFTIARQKIKVPMPKVIELRKPPVEKLEPEELWPFGADWPRAWRGDKEALEEYREALNRLREARRKLWRSLPQPAPFGDWGFPELRLFEPGAPDVFQAPKEFRMEMDMRETDDAITIKCDMPGMKKDDIEISLKGNVLTIKGERSVEEESKDEEGRIVRRERRSGSFSRTQTLPGNIKSEDIKTSYENGVLTIIIPKEKPTPEEEKEIRINIGTI